MLSNWDSVVMVSPKYGTCHALWFTGFVLAKIPTLGYVAIANVPHGESPDGIFFILPCEVETCQGSFAAQRSKKTT